MGKDKEKNKNQENMTADNPEFVESETSDVYASDIPIGMRPTDDNLTEEEREARKSEDENM